MLIQVPQNIYEEVLEPLARARVENKKNWDTRKGNSKSKEWGAQMAERGEGIYERMCFGLACEYAAAIATAGRIDRSIYKRGDGGSGDVEVEHNGRLVQIGVKGRTRRGEPFATNSTSPAKFKPEYGLLVWPAGVYRPGVNPGILEVVGIFHRSTLEKEGRVRDLGHGQRLTLSREFMIPIARRMGHPEWTKLDEMFSMHAPITVSSVG